MPQHAKEIADVVSWTFYPYPRKAIHDYLKALSETQIHILMTDFKGAAATLGWLEFGRRRGYIAAIHLQVIEVKGEFEVKVGLDAPAIVENITLDHKWKDGE